MDNSIKIEAHGTKVRITEGGAVYVEINGTTVYFENYRYGRILDVWTEGQKEDVSLSLTDYINENL